MSANFENILYSLKDGIAEIRLNRPDRLNAVTEGLYAELRQLLQTLEKDDDARMIVITGEGRAFCVGADMKAHGAATRTAYQRRQYLAGEQNLCLTIQKMSKPVVAAVNGYALGAGAEIAVAADFILMKDSAQIGFPEIGIGTFLGGGVTHTLPRLVGLAKARELVFFGEKIKGPEAVSIGMANRSFPDEEFDASVKAFCQQLADGAPTSMALAKEQLNASSDRDYESTLRFELEGMTFCTTTADWQEGVDSFKEKRKPNFRR